MRKYMLNIRLALLAGLIGFFSINLQAQAGTSSITGTITDSQGNAVPNATVTLIAGENSRRTTVTNESGVYTFSSVQTGTYQIEVEGTGFKKSSVSNVQALVDKATNISVVLEIGAVSETVNIDATGIESIVNTQDASIGNNFVEQQIRQLPLNARNVANLLSLQAAVTPDGSVSGSRSDQANITLDGVDVNNQQQNSAFSPVLRVTPDSIEEFRVTTSNPNASQGRSAGAQISLVTRSGDNQFRGALYEYHRNTVTTANDYFNNLTGVKRPQLIRNLFGGRLGGPIAKDRLFFFYNYEGFREAKQVTVIKTVPLASLGQGILKFKDTAGSTITLNATQINALTSNGLPVVNVNPVALSILSGAAARYVSNDSSVGDGLNTGGYRFNAAAPVNQNTHTARFDWNVTNDQKHVISVRGNYQNDNETFTSAFPDTIAPKSWSHPLGFAVNYTWLVNSNLTNRIGYGLTRLAFSDQGDSTDNAISFRFVYSPSNFSRTLNRVNPTHNITDDITWIKGNHTLQFGTNIRIIRNKRTNFNLSYDNGVANESYYASSGNVLLTPVNDYLEANTGTEIDPGWEQSVQESLTAIFGRLSQYSANYNFDINGKPLGLNAPNTREWATEEYDFYAQDSWKFRPNLTLTLGLRYGLSRPVYETQGYQATPNIPLQIYFERRRAAAEKGQNYTEPLIFDLAGPKNGKPGFYKLDKNNFQPRVAVAWSPGFKTGFLSKLFGKAEESVIRGGFSITNDYFGQQLAVSFDAANTLGFSTSSDISANAFNITTRPAPLITGLGMNIKNLPFMSGPSTLTFPQQQPADNQRRIETSLDTDLVSPINYSWNLSYGRKLPLKMYLDVSYIGRAARNLLATRDVMTTNNIKDPKSGQTWYEAATALELQRRAGVPFAQIQSQPFFENLYNAAALADYFGYGGTNSQIVYQGMINDVGGNDWTYMQTFLDDVNPLFYQNQYAALSSFGTIGNSDYHAMALSVRQRAKGLTWDLNYTFSKSIDDASGLQTSGGFGLAFILNPLRQRDNRAVSDFDMRHIVNFNSVWEVPIGRNRQFGGGMSKVLDAFIGGWQLTNVFRYNSGVPLSTNVFFDNAGWVTNWNAQSNGVRNQPLESSESKTGGTDALGNRVPNIFSNVLSAYRSFRSPLPGETGDRNQLRLPSFFTLDAGLYKTFNSPLSENHKIQFRWEVFNVTNTARMGGTAADGSVLASNALGYQPNKGNPPASWGNFTAQQGTPRVMQFALRYDF